MKNSNISNLAQCLAIVSFVAMVMCNPAYAQVEKVNSVLTILKNVLIGAGLLITTCAIMFAGFKMMWQHAKWAEISNIVIGAILVGGASSFAGVLLS